MFCPAAVETALYPNNRDDRQNTDEGVPCIEVDNNDSGYGIGIWDDGTDTGTGGETGGGTDDECCAKLELSLENDASANQGQRAGNYEIQAENYNDRNVWKRVDGQYVLWFNSDTDYWTIGSSLGSGGGIFAPSEFDCPNDAGSQWTYYEVGSSNTFLDAGNDVSLQCQGKEQL